MKHLWITIIGIIALAGFVAATDITLEGTVTIPQPGKDVWVTNIGGVDYAFVNAGEEGVRKIRISDRTEVASFIPTAGAVKDIWVKDTLIFVANYGDTILYILDGSLNPVGKIAEIAVSSVDTQYRAEALTVSPDTQNVVFIAVRRIVGSDQSVFLYVVDAKNPTAPRLVMRDIWNEPSGGLGSEHPEDHPTDLYKYLQAINIGNNSVIDMAVVGHERKWVTPGPRVMSNCAGGSYGWYCDNCYGTKDYFKQQWWWCSPTGDSVDVWYIGVVLANSDSAWLSIYNYDWLHVSLTRRESYGNSGDLYGCSPSCGATCGDGTATTATITAPFAYKHVNATYYGPASDTLQDQYTFSSTKAYQMWVGSHAGTEYAFIARGSDGLWVLPLHPGIGTSEDIGDPIIAGYKASDADDYRDVYIYGDLIFLANYVDAPGEKLFSVLNAAALEDSTLEETASYNEFFGEGIWGDSLRVYVVGDSL